MAQKSLPILNKVGTSMVWYTTYYYKHYKWLSSQNLYLLYFFNKLFVYLDFLFLNLLWLKPYTTNLYPTKKNPSVIRYTRVRFFKPVTSYLLSIGSYFTLFNIYYSTSLESFQQISKESTRKEFSFFSKLLVKSDIRSMFFK